MHINTLRLALPACALLLSWMGWAPAQASDQVQVSSPALACLTMAEGAASKPDYPEFYIKRKEGGKVKVQLDFAQPDAAPAVTLLSKTQHPELNDIIEDYVKRFRVPCMKAANGPVRLTQQYVFDPDGAARVVAAPTRDADDAERLEQLSCIKTAAGHGRPRYAQEALRNEQTGTFIVKMQFHAADQPPALSFLAAPASRSLRESVSEYAAGLRMPCLRSKPVELIYSFIFSLEGDSRKILRDTRIDKLVGGARKLQRPAYFDFNKMACPFDLRMQYLQPFSRNQIQQLDSALDAREPLMDWLESLTLDVDGPTSASIYGSTMLITVPCGKIDI